MRTKPFSGRQYAMLQALYDNKIEGGMTIEDAQRFDQRPFRSMLMRGWCTYRSNGNRGFHITKEGVQAMEDFHTANILRANPTLPLTAYFDPTAYGLEPGKKKPVMEKKQHTKRLVRQGRGSSVREFIVHQRAG
jgi:hypothetical protein